MLKVRVLVTFEFQEDWNLFELVVVLTFLNRVSSCRCCSKGFSLAHHAGLIFAFIELQDQFVQFIANFAEQLKKMVENIKMKLALHEAFDASVQVKAIQASKKVDSISGYELSSIQEVRHFQRNDYSY